MIKVVANTSPLIPYQFPGIYQTNGPNFINFVKAYFTWLEQANNSVYYARNYYNIKDIDNTFDDFIVYFKEKYLVNIQFATEVDIRMVIKHALDIYRSKGTERCAKLLFKIAFNEEPFFYYPSTDLFRLSDGQWFQPQYLELTFAAPNPNNLALQQKEIQGVTSGAIAFVDNIIRRFTLDRYEDVAYISAIQGQFVQGEVVQPTDGSLSIEQCPSIMGSLNSLVIANTGSGDNYTVGSLIPLATSNGTAGLLRVANTINQPGLVDITFVDGGWGFYTNATTTAIGYNSATGDFPVGTNIYTYYGNNSVMGIGLVTQSSNSSNSVGNIVVDVLQGSVDNTFYSYANAVHGSINSFSTSTYGPTVYISNANIILANLSMDTANLEQSHYFGFLDELIQPMVTITYNHANAALLSGDLITQYYSNNLIEANGVILSVVASNSSSGTILVNVYNGPFVNNQLFYTTANAIQANAFSLANSSATAQFIANSDTITLAISTSSGTFLTGEPIYQMNPMSGPLVDQKVEGWGYVASSGSSEIVVANVQGRFIAGNVAAIIGGVSLATATVTSASIEVGVVNVSGIFFASPQTYVYSPIMQGSLEEYINSGTGFSVILSNNLLYTEAVTINTDQAATYNATLCNALAYGFPANPNANGTSGNLNSTLNYIDLTIGEIANVFIVGVGQNFNDTPFIVLDAPWVSTESKVNHILNITVPTTDFQVGELVQQNTTNALGRVQSLGNTTFLYVENMSYANGFVVTTDSSTGIIGLSSGALANVIQVDYDIFSNYMGRNANITSELFQATSAILSGQVVGSGFGFSNGETIAIGSNGATGQVVLGGIGTAQGYYTSKGGFLSDQKKLFDGYFWQNFSYEIISNLMVDKYYNMIQEITHPAGTIMFGEYVHNAENDNSLVIENSIIDIFANTSLVSAVENVGATLNNTLQVNKTVVFQGVNLGPWLGLTIGTNGGNGFAQDFQAYDWNANIPINNTYVIAAAANSAFQVPASPDPNALSLDQISSSVAVWTTSPFPAPFLPATPPQYYTGTVYFNLRLLVGSDLSNYTLNNDFSIQFVMDPGAIEDSWSVGYQVSTPGPNTRQDDQHGMPFESDSIITTSGTLEDRSFQQVYFLVTISADLSTFSWQIGDTPFTLFDDGVDDDTITSNVSMGLNDPLKGISKSLTFANNIV
jgi:hypothetical protein